MMFASCSAPRLQVAREQMSRGEYYAASRTFRGVYNKLRGRDNRLLRGEVAYDMAECYRRLNMHAKAEAAYRNALRYGHNDSTAMLFMGQAMQAQGKYVSAIEAYEDYLATSPSDTVQAISGISGCREALADGMSTRYEVRQARNFYSSRSEFCPVFYGDDYDIVYFTTTNERVMGSSRSDITGVKPADIWLSRKNEHGQWLVPEPAPGELNSDCDEGAVAFSSDGMVMYLSRACRDSNADSGVEIYTSTRVDAAWSAPVRLDIGVDSMASVGQPAVSPDGEWLYFVSDMPGGYGGKDLWRVNLHEPGARPHNLGPAINTRGNEMFPCMRADSVLYFSSDGHAGMGGLDLFRAEMTVSGGWHVVNMGAPMNSPADDFGITFGPGESGFFSSGRGDARGYDHIYAFECPEVHITLSGTVLDFEDMPVENAVVRVVGNDGFMAKTAVRGDGTFTMSIERGVSYAVRAGAKDYLGARQEFTTDTCEEDADYAVAFRLASLTRPNVVDNIFYDFDKATLRPESKIALDSLVDVLRDNPGVTIEMGSHTDRKGSDEYNIMLSRRRAKAVVDYLIAAGIDSDRLLYKGYGRSCPMTVTRRLARIYSQFAEGDVLTPDYVERLDETDREIADQINRRTDFRVIDAAMY